MFPSWSPRAAPRASVLVCCGALFCRMAGSIFACEIMACGHLSTTPSAFKQPFRWYGALQASFNNPFRWLCAFQASSTNPSKSMGPSRHLSTTPSDGFVPSKLSSNSPSEGMGPYRRLSVTPSERYGAYGDLVPQSFFPVNQPLRGGWLGSK